MSSLTLSPKFDPFTTHTTTYKTVFNQPIPLWLLIPKNCPPGPRPLLVQFHGGFLITGHAMFPDWTPQWSLDYVLKHNSLMIRANYRLIPESSGLDILEDVNDLWNWVGSSLGGYLKELGIEQRVDLTKVMVYGESAGAYLAIQSGLMKRNLVKAVVAAYPMTYLDEDWYTKSGVKPLFGMGQLDPEILERHFKGMKEGGIVTGVFPPGRLDLCLVILQQGWAPKVIGTDESLYPVKVLGKAEEGGKGPFLFLMHGESDKAVPAEHSKRFVKVWKKTFGERAARGWFVEGKEHGFDGEYGVEDEGLKEGLEDVTQAWLD